MPHTPIKNAAVAAAINALLFMFFSPMPPNRLQPTVTNRCLQLPDLFGNVSESLPSVCGCVFRFLALFLSRSQKLEVSFFAKFRPL